MAAPRARPARETEAVTAVVGDAAAPDAAEDVGERRAGSAERAPRPAAAGCGPGRRQPAHRRRHRPRAGPRLAADGRQRCPRRARRRRRDGAQPVAGFVDLGLPRARHPREQPGAPVLRRRRAGGEAPGPVGRPGRRCHARQRGGLLVGGGRGPPPGWHRDDGGGGHRRGGAAVGDGQRAAVRRLATQRAGPAVLCLPRRHQRPRERRPGDGAVGRGARQPGRADAHEPHRARRGADCRVRGTVRVELPPSARCRPLAPSAAVDRGGGRGGMDPTARRAVHRSRPGQPVADRERRGSGHRDVRLVDGDTDRDGGGRPVTVVRSGQLRVGDPALRTRPLHLGDREPRGGRE